MGVTPQIAFGDLWGPLAQGAVWGFRQIAFGDLPEGAVGAFGDLWGPLA